MAEEIKQLNAEEQVQEAVVEVQEEAAEVQEAAAELQEAAAEVQEAATELQEAAEGEEATEAYLTFTVDTRSGEKAEMAIVDEFDYDGKHYIVAQRVIGDEISGDGQYIYRAKMLKDDFTAEKILDKKEYEAVAKAYMEM